jgi:hypothetical protein
VSEEEIAEDGIKNGNKKGLVLAARHGPGLSDGDYINFNMRGECAKITELKTRNENRLDKKAILVELINEEYLQFPKLNNNE